MILNAVALCFIVDVDELVFAAYTTPRHRAGLGKRVARINYGVHAGENTYGRDTADNRASRWFFGSAASIWRLAFALLYSSIAAAWLCA